MGMATSFNTIRCLYYLGLFLHYSITSDKILYDWCSWHYYRYFINNNMGVTWNMGFDVVLDCKWRMAACYWFYRRGQVL